MSTIPIRRGVVFKKVSQNNAEEITVTTSDQNKEKKADENSTSLNTSSIEQQVPVLNIPSKTTDAASMFINQDQMSSASSDGLPASHEVVLDWAKEAEMLEQGIKEPVVRPKKYVPSFDLKMKSSPGKSTFTSSSPVASSIPPSNFAPYKPSYSSSQGFQPKKMDLSSHTPPGGYEQMQQPQPQPQQLHQQYQQQPNTSMMYQNNPQSTPQFQQQTSSSSYMPYGGGGSIVINIVPGSTSQMMPGQMMMVNPEPPKQAQPVYATPMPNFIPGRDFQTIQKPVPVKQEYVPPSDTTQESTASSMVQTPESEPSWHSAYANFQKMVEPTFGNSAAKGGDMSLQTTPPSDFQSIASTKSRPSTPVDFEVKLFDLNGQKQQHTKGLRPGSRCQTPGLVSQQQVPVEPMSYAKAFTTDLNDKTAFKNVVMPRTTKRTFTEIMRERLLEMELQHANQDEGYHRECRDMYEDALNEIRAPHHKLTAEQMMEFFGRTFTQEELEQPPQDKYTNITELQNYDNIVRWGDDAAYTHIPPKPTSHFTFRPVNSHGYIIPQFGPVRGTHMPRLSHRETEVKCVDPDGTIIPGTVQRIVAGPSKHYKKTWIQDGGKMYVYALEVATLWVDEAFPGIVDIDIVQSFASAVMSRKDKRVDELCPAMRAEPVNNHFCSNKTTPHSCKICETFKRFMYHLRDMLLLVVDVPKDLIPWYGVYGINYYAVNGLLSIKPTVEMVYRLGVMGAAGLLSVDVAIYDMSNQDLEVWVTCIYDSPDKEYLKKLRITHVIDYQRTTTGKNSTDEIHKGHTCCHKNVLPHICLACFKILNFIKRNLSADKTTYKSMKKLIKQHKEIPSPDYSGMESVE